MAAAPFLNDFRSIREVGHLPVECTDIGRIHLLEDREYFVTDAVAAVFHRCIGLVLPVGYLPFEDISFYLLSCESQEGAEDCHVAALLAMTWKAALLAMTWKAALLAMTGKAALLAMTGKAALIGLTWE